MLFLQLTLAIAWLDYVERSLGAVGRFIGPDRGDELSFREARRILHVADDASPDVIKTAYKALALKYHPDRGGSDHAMERLNAAYRRLSRRRSYFAAPAI